MICRERKLIFVHIPKTGGTSVEDMIWPAPRAESDLWMGFVRPGFNKYQTGGLQHLTVRHIRREVGPKMFRECYRFALIRHPVDRLVSGFNYLNRRGDLRALLGLGPKRSFSAYLRRIQRVKHVQWMPQADFLLDHNDEMAAEVFKLENIGQTLGTLAAKVGLTETALAHSNKTLADGVKEGWVVVRKNDVSDEDRQIIQRLYGRDFDLLGYDPKG